MGRLQPREAALALAGALLAVDVVFWGWAVANIATKREPDLGAVTFALAAVADVRGVLGAYGKSLPYAEDFTRWSPPAHLLVAANYALGFAIVAFSHTFASAASTLAYFAAAGAAHAGAAAAARGVRVIEIPRSFGPPLGGARALMLDDSSNIHSVHFPADADASASGGSEGGGDSKGSSGRLDAALTDSYWDVIGAAASLVPPRAAAPVRVGVMGLAGGTCAHVALEAARERHAAVEVVGWELDEVVVEAALLHMGLGELADEGCLTTVVGDALEEPQSTEVGALDVVCVDLFADSALLPQLAEEGAWRAMSARLVPGSGVMVANLSDERDKFHARAMRAVARGVPAGYALYAKDLGLVADCVSANVIVVAAPEDSPLDFGAWARALPQAFDSGGRTLTREEIGDGWLRIQ
eukprot:PRCOL_00004230-RA